MVNARFPVAADMVSKWWMRQMLFLSDENAINRKFTPNRKSIAFFPNFRRIRLNPDMCDLSAAVSQESLIAGIDRNGNKRNGLVAKCFFCFAWRSGSGWCSCCCPERRHLHPKSCRSWELHRPYPLRVPRCRTWASFANASRPPVRWGGRLRL